MNKIPDSYKQVMLKQFLQIASGRNSQLMCTKIMAQFRTANCCELTLNNDIGADKLCVSFGIGNKLRNISIHYICTTISLAKANALSAFHALTGSHNTSLFSGTGK